MVIDYDWMFDYQVVEVVYFVVDYLYSMDMLILVLVFVVGYFDDVILVDVVWLQLVYEVVCYQDYCWLCVIEVELCGCEVELMLFSWDDWQCVCVLEVEFIVYCWCSGLGSYLLGQGLVLFWVS